LSHIKLIGGEDVAEEIKNNYCRDKKFLFRTLLSCLSAAEAQSVIFCAVLRGPP
jgi:hypothetical protein